MCEKSLNIFYANANPTQVNGKYNADNKRHRKTQVQR